MANSNTDPEGLFNPIRLPFICHTLILAHQISPGQRPLDRMLSQFPPDISAGVAKSSSLSICSPHRTFLWTASFPLIIKRACFKRWRWCRGSWSLQHPNQLAYRTWSHDQRVWVPRPVPSWHAVCQSLTTDPTAFTNVAKIQLGGLCTQVYLPNLIFQQSKVGIGGRNRQ